MVEPRRFPICSTCHTETCHEGPGPPSSLCIYLSFSHSSSSTPSSSYQPPCVSEPLYISSCLGSNIVGLNQGPLIRENSFTLHFRNRFLKSLWKLECTNCMKTGFLYRHDFLINQSNLFMFFDCGSKNKNQVCLQPDVCLQAKYFYTFKLELVGPGPNLVPALV